MSKIYDALRRAEQDRDLVSSEVSRKKQNDSFPPLISELESQVALLPELTDAMPGVEILAKTGQEPEQLNNRSIPDMPGIPFARISSGVWSPDWSHLPALDTRGPQLEQFRALRSRVHELRAATRLKSIMIGSGLPQEGKSFITVNLALALASSKGNRVLLIDGDMRRASVHHLLGAQSKPGLSDYLGGKAGLEEIFQSGVAAEDQAPLPEAFASFTFIGAGADPENAADLSGSRRFAELLRIVEPHFEWIIVDSSPVNLVADSVNLARACDGVLFIVRSGETRLEFAKRALEQLKASRLLGVVLNAVEHLPASHSYYGYSRDEAGEK